MKQTCTALFLGVSVMCRAADNVPGGLMCELMAHPERALITDARPDFSWVVNSPAQNDVQVAYQILVAGSAERLAADRGDLWDSGKVSSAQSVAVEYAGKPLTSGASCWWKVRTFLASATPPGWSEAQQFHVGILRQPGGEAGPPPSLAGAHWIWFPEQPGAATRYFRKTVSIPADRKVKQAIFLITADDRFTLRVNGKTLASTSGHNAWKTFRCIDIVRALSKGDNLIMVEAANTGDAAGVTGCLRISYGAGPETEVPIDTTWETSQTANGPWQQAKSLGKYGVAPWGTTAEIPARLPAAVAHDAQPVREVLANRYLPVREPRRPVKVVNVADGHWYFDFGKAAFGTVKLQVNSPAAANVDVHLGEECTGERVNRKPGGTRRYRKMTVPIDKGEGAYTVRIPADRRNTGGAAIKMPASVGEVMPFRYCEISGCPAALDADSVEMIAVHYPFDKDAAAFRSSDGTLDAVWELCKYSIEATSFCGVYVDGDRERIPYEADAYINQLGHYCTDREYTMARYSHEYLISHPTWPTEWAPHSVFMAWADYEYTGDRESLTRCYDDLKAKTLYELARDDGLISTKSIPAEVLHKLHIGKLRDIVDWPTGERDGYDFKDINTVVNAFHYRACVLFAQIAEALGKAADAADFRGRAERVGMAINGKLFDAARGVYIDGEGSRHASLHANMWPLAFGLVPPERVAGVVTFVKSRKMACSVYAAQYLLEGLYEAGEGEYALSLLTSRGKRSWWNMLREGSTISMEAWGNEFKGNQDWNHAWGAVPANVIPRQLMGVTPLAPGFGRIRIKPQVGSLTNASLKTPTIRGPVYVAVQQEPGKSFALSARLPANTKADVYLPAWGGTEIEVDGTVVRGEADGAFAVVRDVGSGEHRFVTRR